VTTHPIVARTGALPAPLAEGVRRLAAEAAAQDGVPPLSEQPLLWLSGGDATHLLVLDGDVLLGYAQVDLRDPAQATAEVVVHPGRRRRGIGTALLTAAREAVVAAAASGAAAGGAGAGGAAAGAARAPAAPASASDPTSTWPGAHDARADAPRTDDPAAPVLSVWAHGDLPPARALAAHRHLPVTRELWQMRRTLDPAVPPSGAVPPPGVTVRAFEPGRDEDAWLRVNARAFAHHPEQGRLTRADLDDRTAEEWFDPAGLLLAEQDGRLLASGWTKVVPGEDAGEIYALGVDPDAQGRGLGRLLTALMLDHLAARGLHAVLLYTEGDNHPAIRVYQGAGFERSAVDVVYAV
jgi:mycothiol synthase